jgi:hypothetical protein
MNEDEKLNHDEALQLAFLRRDESNLARCYVDLATRTPSPSSDIEQIISAWAFAHNIDGAARNDLFVRIRAALTDARASERNSNGG